MRLFHVGMIGVIVFGFTGCCLNKLTLKSDINAVDLKAVSAGTIKPEASFEFKECCPTKKQKENALELQSKINALFDKLTSGQITIEQYNQTIKAAHDAINNVILVCNSTNDVQLKSFNLLKSSNSLKQSPSKEIQLEDAWKNLEKVEQSL